MREADFEVIVVDNGSVDDTKYVVESFKKEMPNIIYRYSDTPGLHVGRHLGLKHARGEIIVYGDDDIEADPDWLAAISHCFEDSTVALVGGNNYPSYEVDPPHWIDDLWIENRYGKCLGQYSLIDFGGTPKEISPMYVWGCNFSIRKSVLLESEGFHPDGMPKNLIRLRGDGEQSVTNYVLEKGYITMFNPYASVYHWVSKERMTFEYIYSRSFAQGVSHSYSDARELGKRSLSRVFELRIRKILLKMRKRLKMLLGKKQTVWDVICQGEIDGYQFHQKELGKDNTLMQWVKKNNYMD